jgi:F-type H+-transporting ATPase subunit b
MEIDFSHIITQTLAFLVMLWVLKRFGWTPLLNILQERREFIQSELETVAAQKETVQKLTTEYEEKLKQIESEARVKIQEAVLEGRRIAALINEEAQSNARESLLKSRVEIQREMDRAKSELRNELVNVVITTTEKILQAKLDGELHRKLIADFIEEAEHK